MLAFLGIGPLEWLVLLGGAVLLFGGDLPQVMRKLARFLGRLRAMAAELSREVDLHGEHERDARPPASLPAPPRPLPKRPEQAQDGATEPRPSGARPAGADDDASADAGGPAPPGAPGAGPAPPDHSDWAPETGSDRPARLGGDTPDDAEPGGEPPRDARREG